MYLPQTMSHTFRRINGISILEKKQNYPFSPTFSSPIVSSGPANKGHA